MHFFDAGSVAVADKTDGGHLDAANTKAIGVALVPVVKKILLDLAKNCHPRTCCGDSSQIQAQRLT